MTFDRNKGRPPRNEKERAQHRENLRLDVERVYYDHLVDNVKSIRPASTLTPQAYYSPAPGTKEWDKMVEDMDKEWNKHREKATEKAEALKVGRAQERRYRAAKKREKDE